MDQVLSEEVDEYVKSAELNLKMEVKEAKKRRDSQLIVVSNSSGSSKKSYFGSTTISSIESSVAGGGTPHSESSFLTSFTQIEDIEMPSSFNSSTIGLEEMLSISEESPLNILAPKKDDSHQFKKSVKLKNENRMKDSEDSPLIPLNSASTEEGTTCERWSSCNTSGVNTFFLCSETEKVLEALESENQGSYKGFASSSSSRLTILDLTNLNDSLLTATPNSKRYEANGLQNLRDVPSMSTPKNSENIEENSIVNECGITLNFNGTFDTNSPPVKKENIFVVDEKHFAVTNLPLNETKTLAVNTTFDKKTENNAETGTGQKMNVTYEAEPPKENDNNLNRTFEVVGNGSFIIEGKYTNLMDMESEALETVLGSALSTPISRGTKSYPDTKKVSKSTLRKRLSMLTCQSQEDVINEQANSGSFIICEQQGSREKALPASILESHNPLGPLTKQQVLSRLRKKTNPGSLLGNGGPMKAVPLSSVIDSVGQIKYIENVKKRATSTPTDRLHKIHKDVLSDTNNSEEKVGKIPSLPSFGSVSSIGTEGLSREVGSDEFMVTPEVFRHRSKLGGPHITSTPTAMPCNLKFVTDLGLGSAPTPIVAPVKDGMELKTEKNNCSYVVEDSKRAKSKLNFTTSNEGSPDSVFIKECVNDKIKVIDEPVQGVSFSKEETLSPNDDCPKERNEQSLINEELKDLDSGIVLASTAKEVIVMPECLVIPKDIVISEDIVIQGDIAVPEGTKASIGELLRNDNVLKSDNQSKMEARTKALTTTSRDEDDTIEVKSAPYDDNLTSIKDSHLSNKRLNEINSKSEVDQKTAKFPPMLCCCQCGNVKMPVQSDNSRLVGEYRQQEEGHPEFLKRQDSEIGLLQNVAANANEVIEAYEQLYENEIQNFTNELSETQTDMKSELYVTANSKNDLLPTPRQDTQSKDNSSMASRNSNKADASTSKRFKISVPKESSSKINNNNNTDLKVTTSGRRLTFAKPQTLKPSVRSRESSIMGKRENLNVKSVRPVLKPVNAGNNPSFRRRESLQKDLDSNNQACKPEFKTVPPKSLPKFKTSLRAKALPEIKPVSKVVPLPAKTLPKPVSNDQLKPDSVQTKVIPGKLVPKVANINVKSTLSKSRSPNRLPQVPSASTGLKSSTVRQSRVSYSSANKENGVYRSTLPRRSVVASGIRPPSIRTSIQVPRNFK